MSSIGAAARERIPGIFNQLAADRDDVACAAGLALLGTVSASIYLLLTVEMSLLEFFPGPGITLDFVKMLGPDWQKNSALLLSSFAALFGLWTLALIWLGKRSGPTAVTVVFATAVVFAVVLTFMYPPMSVDFIHNVSDARTLFRFGDNPLVTPPAANPFPVGQSYSDEPAPYGPLWFMLLFPVVLAGDSIQWALHILKFYTSLYYLGSALLIFLIARQLTPGREVFATILYAWNPFVVWRAAGNGHNDIVMFFFVLLAVWLMLRGQWRYVVPLLLASALVKYVSLILIPPVFLAGFLLAADRRLFWRETGFGLGISLALLFVTFAPFWDVMTTFDAARDQAGKFITSTPLLAREELVRHTALDSEAAGDLARWGGFAIFLGAYAYLLFALSRRGGAIGPLVACMALSLLAFNLLAVTWYRPWYMLWPLTLLPLVPGRWSVALIAAISVGGMLPDIIEQYRLNLGFFREHYLWAIAAPVIPAFLPALVVLVAAWLQTRSPLLDEQVHAESRPSYAG
jgi:hypothetical protein